MMNVQYKVIVLQVNVGWSVVFMCYSTCFVRRRNIKFITYLVMCSQSLTISKEKVFN